MKISNIVFGFFLILDLTLSIKAINEVNTFKPCFPYENCTDDGQAECKDLGGKCCGEYCCNIQYFEALQKFEYNEEDDTCKVLKKYISQIYYRSLFSKKSFFYPSFLSSWLWNDLYEAFQIGWKTLQ